MRQHNKQNEDRRVNNDKTVDRTRRTFGTEYYTTLVASCHVHNTIGVVLGRATQ